MATWPPPGPLPSLVRRSCAAAGGTCVLRVHLCAPGSAVLGVCAVCMPCAPHKGPMADPHGQQSNTCMYACVTGTRKRTRSPFPLPAVHTCTHNGQTELQAANPYCCCLCCYHHRSPVARTRQVNRSSTCCPTAGASRHRQAVRRPHLPPHPPLLRLRHRLQQQQQFQRLRPP